MVLVKIHDKRHHKGYRIKFFDTEEVNKEVIDFVKETPKVFFVMCKTTLYHSREEFLRAFGEESE